MCSGTKCRPAPKASPGGKQYLPIALYALYSQSIGKIFRGERESVRKRERECERSGNNERMKDMQ